MSQKVTNAVREKKIKWSERDTEKGTILSKIYPVVHNEKVILKQKPLSDEGAEWPTGRRGWRCSYSIGLVVWPV